MDGKKRAYSIYSVSRLLFEELALAAIAFWLLPRFGIKISLWLIIVFMVVWAIYSYFISRLVAKVVGQATAVGPETLIGVTGITITPLFPKGYVRIGTELWKVRSTAGKVDVGTEIIIVGINRLTLLAEPLEKTKCDQEETGEINAGAN